MDVQERLRNMVTISCCMAGIMAGLLAYPPSACAVEVGCFCTFVFVSTMFMLGIGVTMLIKYLLAKKIWKLSKTRTVFITCIEVVLMVSVLILLQTEFYLRVLAYLPLAFLLNYALTTARAEALEGRQNRKKRAALAALSSLVLPAAVQVMAWLATVLSNLITFKEVRV